MQYYLLNEIKAFNYSRKAGYQCRVSHYF